MATTESRPGFRLPWTAEGSASDAVRDADPGADGSTPAEATEQAPAEPGALATAGSTNAAAPGGTSGPESIPTAAPAEAEANPSPESPTPSPGTTAPGVRRRSNAFLAELARAMHAAALEARERVLEQFRGESKAFIEELHARSAEEITALRRAADDDVAAIRDWSKAEIARIREETERRIAERKAALEEEIEAQAARIEAQIERLQGAVGSFEAEMDRFFERLLAVDDPTEFAALAANLPEPPPFDEILAGPAAVRTPTPEPLDAAPEAEAMAPEAEAAEAMAPEAETGPAEAATLDAEPTSPTPELDEAAREAAFTAIEAAARAAETAEDPEITGAIFEGPAAEGDELEGLDDDAIAARLAGLLGTRDEVAAPPSPPVTTTVAVVGLVSVASIAGFKRHLAHLPGVDHVGVASGPAGEFVFTVSHDPELDLAAAVPTLPSFGARVTESRPGRLAVTAHDPDLSA